LQRNSNQTNLHLKNFHIIVPPLTINFIEHILVCKDKLTKKGGGKDAFTFTDDGFAIGIAYILKLLDQHKEFEALHWFESVNDKYKEEQLKLEKNLAQEQKGGKREIQQTYTLTMNKIKNYQREFDLFFYSFSGAKIFFKD